MNISDEGLKLIMQFEGLRLKAYRCPAGVWTIGYGHTSAAGAPEVRDGMRISAQEAEAILKTGPRGIRGRRGGHGQDGTDPGPVRCPGVLCLQLRGRGA